jgi:SAM-dependent methyltransferase
MKIYKVFYNRLLGYWTKIKNVYQEMKLEVMLKRFRESKKTDLDPEKVGTQVRNYAQKFDNYPPYFDCLEFEDKFIRPFVSKSVKAISELQPNRFSSILDVCGGPGNQGLALIKNGYFNYMNSDIDPIRMKWGALIWLENGYKMNYLKMDASKKFIFDDQTFDIVTLLGWETPTLPYTYTLAECARVLKEDGLLIFTYHDEFQVIEGNWDSDPERQYSFLPYSIGEDSLKLIVAQNNLVTLSSEYSGYKKELHDFFPDKQLREFPQKIMVCKKKS